MSIDIKDVLADITFKVFSDEEIILEGGNPLVLYNETLEGNLLDIGCGQSAYIIGMLNTNLKIYALDPDPKQIDYLLQRVNRIAEGRKIYTINKPFSSNLFPDMRFDFIVMSNILHLKEDIPDPHAFIQDVKQVMSNNCAVLLVVHEGKEEDDYFKRFTLNELKTLFPDNEFEYIYHSYHSGKTNKYAIRFGEEYMNMDLNERGIYDPAQRTLEISEYHKLNKMSELIFLVKKK